MNFTFQQNGNNNSNNNQNNFNMMNNIHHQNNTMMMNQSNTFGNQNNHGFVSNSHPSHGMNNSFNGNNSAGNIPPVNMNSLEIIPDGRSLFLGDLSVYCSEKDVKELFLPYGPIEAIKLKRGSNDRNHLSYGFVRFISAESAENALKSLTGVVFLGRPLRLGWAQPNVGKRFQPKDPLQNIKTAQIHVSFISKQVDALVSEATLRSLFGLYGNVVDVTIKKSQFDQKLRIQNGYGFIHYPMTSEGIVSAIHATRGVHQITVDRVTYDCSLSHALQQIVQNDKYFAAQAALPPVAPSFHVQALGNSSPATSNSSNFSPSTSSGYPQWQSEMKVPPKPEFQQQRAFGFPTELPTTNAYPPSRSASFYSVNGTEGETLRFPHSSSKRSSMRSSVSSTFTAADSEISTDSFDDFNFPSKFSNQTTNSSSFLSFEPNFLAKPAPSPSLLGSSVFETLPKENSSSIFPFQSFDGMNFESKNMF